ncbi:hypothetical protein COV56_03240 [Candidatus Kuenenbacteria bacterium CG11_big_fil_rev_8_21_14_0_20_37_9]|uniref:Ribonucleotide reductase large subunit N-terminal domain-containing protein n=1 Tax=Candidatus Kuenenbacteria bacterium CG08_land_8_20_14_0_20_37_23 TaxID=1974617 RepID=A0A2M6XT41_9BACT|nr:MAG: hypothetical protein COV56_03240 [Candidatus Kuenenbacteria bacterium CG11_big_fil_rev_8_21_14_0_20_37_9]PIU10797.1 MAG: hypothetical protein COT27_01260 [Candidatus Kuenenbacteria bacterium CG08_land_8_20_14_0_20_37_23]
MEKINDSTFESLPKMKKFLDQKKIHDFGISGRDESIHDVFSRVSSEITKIENKFSNRERTSQFKKQIFYVLENQKLIPSTTILMNAGRFENAPLSACAVPPNRFPDNPRGQELAKKEALGNINPEEKAELTALTRASRFKSMDEIKFFRHTGEEGGEPTISEEGGKRHEKLVLKQG